MRVRNNKQTSDIWVGQTLSTNQTYDLQPTEIHLWKNNDKVIADLSSGDLSIGDGVTYQSAGANAVNFLLEVDVSPTDADARLMVRPVAAKAGWKAQFHAIRISTSTTNGVYNKDKTGADLGFCTYTMKDANGDTTSDTTQCVQTIVTWEPNYDIEIIGGNLFQASPASQNIYLYVTAAAHIPAQYGGSITFSEGGINLADIGSGQTVDFDGRVSKYIAYDATYHSGRFEILLKHPAAFVHNFTLVFHLFRA